MGSSEWEVLFHLQLEFSHSTNIYVCNFSRVSKSMNTMQVHTSHYVVAESELMCGWFLPQHCS